MTINAKVLNTGERNVILVMRDYRDGKLVRERNIQYGSEESMKKGIKRYMRQYRVPFRRFNYAGAIAAGDNLNAPSFTLVFAYDRTNYPLVTIRLDEALKGMLS